jgi:hypothetical protein
MGQLFGFGMIFVEIGLFGGFGPEIGDFSSTNGNFSTTNGNCSTTNGDCSTTNGDCITTNGDCITTNGDCITTNGVCRVSAEVFSSGFVDCRAWGGVCCSCFGGFSSTGGVFSSSFGVCSLGLRVFRRRVVSAAFQLYRSAARVSWRFEPNQKPECGRTMFYDDPAVHYDSPGVYFDGFLPPIPSFLAAILTIVERTSQTAWCAAGLKPRHAVVLRRRGRR